MHFCSQRRGLSMQEKLSALGAYHFLHGLVQLLQEGPSSGNSASSGAEAA